MIFPYLLRSSENIFRYLSSSMYLYLDENMFRFYGHLFSSSSSFFFKDEELFNKEEYIFHIKERRNGTRITRLMRKSNKIDRVIVRRYTDMNFKGKLLCERF